MKKENEHIKSKPVGKVLRIGKKVIQNPFSKFKDKRPSWMVDFDAH